MRSRPLVLVVGLLLAGVVAVLWRLEGEGSDPAGAAAEGASPAIGSPGADLRRPVAGRAEAPDGRSSLPVGASPVLDEPAPDPAAPAAPAADARGARELPLPQVDVFAFTPEGEPLVVAVREALEGLELWVSASVAPPSDRLAPASAVLVRPDAEAAIVSGSQREDGYVGTLALRAQPPIWVALTLGRQVIAAQPLDAGEQRVEFRIPVGGVTESLGALTFRLVDGPRNVPMPAADLLVTTLTGRGALSLQTDGEGRVVLDPWYVGPCEVMVWGEQASLHVFELETLPGAPTDAGDLQVWPGVLLSGEVVDPDGRPLPGVDLPYYSTTQLGSGFLGVADDEGRFSMRLQPGHWVLDAHSPSEYPDLAFPHVAVDVERDAPPPFVTIQLEPGAPFLLEADEPWARRAQFRISVPGGPVVEAGNLLYDRVWRTRLPLGPYDVDLVAPGGEVLQHVELDHTATGTRVVLDRL